MVRHHRFIIGAFFVSILPAIAGQASAAMITFEFGGVVDTVNDPYGFLEGKVQIGDSFSGSYTFDSDTPDSYPEDNTLGRYLFSSAYMIITVGQQYIIESTDAVNNSITVANDRHGDRFTMGCYRYYSPDLFVVESGISLKDDTEQAFVNDALPLYPPNLMNIQVKQLFIEGGYDGVTNFDFDIQGTVTTLTPEPSSLVMMMIAGLIVGRSCVRYPVTNRVVSHHA